MTKNILFCAALSALTLAASADPAYVATPLRPRLPAPAGQKLFQVMAPEDTGVTVKNLYNDPRMWGDRFRELTLGAVETGIAVADFLRDGNLDIFVVSRRTARAASSARPWSTSTRTAGPTSTSAGLTPRTSSS